MHLCYIDESGTPDVPGNTSHFVLAGLSIPIWQWRNADRQINQILTRYHLAGQELHTAWLLRPYREQTQIADFEKLDRAVRRTAVERERSSYLLALQKANKNETYKQVKKTTNTLRCTSI